MVVIHSGLVTPVLEIMSLVKPLPFDVDVLLDEHPDMTVYHRPPLQSRGSGSKYICNHHPVELLSYEVYLCDTEDEPVVDFEVSNRIVVRYQLNPYCAASEFPFPRVFGNTIYRNQRPYLRPAYVEVAHGSGGCCFNGSGSSYGINVCVAPTDIFAGFPRSNNGDDAVIYSTVPHIRKLLQRPFSPFMECGPLIADDVFVRWGSSGLLSLTDTCDLGMFTIEGVCGVSSHIM
ncbi:uncharacterized protein TEOVI_000853000 [Trypanosoma equiperdum]|uniref:Uncharacterized protein n=1 Tax=Trypanosoma equiperdum TaxID=5694 RepID=A0A1G4IKU6_TRYEQ|nr:hypothetical protein, conserved [Trypanosoma equiperdum]